MKDSFRQSNFSVAAAVLLFGSLAAQAAAPTFIVTSPLNHAIVTNSSIIIKGAAHDASGTVANVFYQVNNSGNWLPAASSNGFATWSGEITNLTPGINTNLIYAVNSLSQPSRTNILVITYEPVALLAVDISGGGKVTPNYAGQNLVIGKKYAVTAAADVGSKFTNWVVSGSNVLTPRLSFTMAAGLSLQANFVESAAPTISVKAPAVTKSSNSVVTVTGTAKDDVGVAEVFYTVNGGATNNHIITTNGFTNWSAVLILNPGANVIQFYAQNGVPITSLPEKLTLVDESLGFAPQSVSGLVLTANAGTTNSLEGFLGTSTYAFVSDGSFAVGNFTYDLTGPSTAVFTQQGIAPFGSGDGSTTFLTFSNTTSGSYSNDSGGGGNFSLAGASGAAPASVDETTILLHGSTLSSNYFADGTGTWTSEPSGNALGAGPFTYVVYSPQVALLTGVLTNSVDQTNFLLLDFGSDTFYLVYTGPATHLLTDSGSFTALLPAKAPAGLARESLAGLKAAVTSTHTQTNNGKKTVTITTPMVSFGEATFAQIDSNTNDDVGVGNYTFSRTGPTTGVLSFYPIAPPTQTNSNGNENILLTFTAGGATFGSGSSDTGHLTLSAASPTVPVSLAGSILLFSPSGKAHSVIIELGYNTYTSIDKGVTNSGTYTLGQFGPQAAFMQFNDLTAVETNYVTMWFTAPTSGTYANTIISADGTVTKGSGRFAP